MRKVSTACALCTLVLSAGAQCAAAAPARAEQQGTHSGWIQAANAGTAEAALGPGVRAPLVQVAAQQMAGPAAAGHKDDGAPEQEHRRRTGPAMLLAALAVMCTIALRRLGASDS